MKNDLAKLFFIISMFFGILFIFIVPPFNSPDEDSHFQYAYQISRGNLIPKEENNVSGFYVPNSITKSIEDDKNQIVGDINKKYSYEKYYYEQFMSQDYKNQTFSQAVIQTAPKLAYLAPTIGIIVAKVLKNYSGVASTQVLLQFARFFSLLIYSLIGYFAIKITPKFKKSFFAVLLLPLSVFLRSMVTYDSILLVTVALTIANIIRLMTGEHKITKKDIALFIITGFLLLNVKMVYSIVFLGLFAIPKSVFNDKKKIKTIMVIGGSILLLSILYSIPYMFINSATEPSSIKQIEFIKNNPFGYIKILLKNIIGQRKVQEYWMLGTLGYLDTYLPILIVYILKIYLFFVFIIEAFYEKIIIPLWLKIGYILLIIFDVFGMYTIMYISWTPKVLNKIGGGEITGIQGRYFLPFLFLIPIIFNNRLVSKIGNKRIINYLEKIKLIFENNFHYITIVCLIITTIILGMRYF